VQGHEDVIDFLNEHLTIELTATNQYFLAYKMLENWGLPGLSKRFRELSMDEMRDAEELIDRILFLEGHPNLQRLNTVQVGEDPVEHIRLGLEAEHKAIEALQRGIELAVSVSDHGTREMLAHMLVEEEEHADYFESQLDVSERVGVELYLARYAMPDGT
jgi:bacterioferritin